MNASNRRCIGLSLVLATSCSRLALINGSEGCQDPRLQQQVHKPLDQGKSLFPLLSSLSTTAGIVPQILRPLQYKKDVDQLGQVHLRPPGWSALEHASCEERLS